MNKRLIAIGLAALLAAGGIAALVFYVEDAEDRAFEGTTLVTVLQVTEEVPAKTPAADLKGKVEKNKIPQSAVVPGSITDLDEVEGLVTNGVLVPGDQITTARFDNAENVVGDIALPEGMQELAIPLEGARIVNGALSPGDRVGLYATYGGTTGNPINQLLLLRIDGGTVEDASAGTVLTFAVDALQAAQIVNVMESGSLWLTKQNEATETDGGRTVTPQDQLP